VARAVEWIEKVNPAAFRSRVAYPERLGYYPRSSSTSPSSGWSFFGGTQPRSLANALLVYTRDQISAARRRSARRRGSGTASSSRSSCESSRRSRRSSGARRGAVAPAVHGLVQEPADHARLLVFILFMLSSTAFDGVRETAPWVQLFWKHIYPLLEPLASGMKQPYLYLVNYYYYWQWLSLALSPLAYLAVYLLFIALARALTRSELSVRELALSFAYTLVPIAFVYNVTQLLHADRVAGLSIVRLVSDPFGRGWNLLGTSGWLREPVILDAGTVWHTQSG
jgi:hypothetical protein